LKLVTLNAVQAVGVETIRVIATVQNYSRKWKNTVLEIIKYENTGNILL